MINNYNLIKDLMEFPNDRSFYYVQIIKRSKENPDLKKNSQAIAACYVRSLDEFDKEMPHIIELCEKNKARAYIRMACLDSIDVGLEMIALATKRTQDKSWKKLARVYNSVCEYCKNQEGTAHYVLVDLDGDYADMSSAVVDFINNTEPVLYREYSEYGHTMTERVDRVKQILPTKNGIHLLVTNLRKQSFSQAWPNIDIHDECMTLLYFPDSCNNNELLKTVGHCPSCGKELVTVCDSTHIEDRFVCTNKVCELYGTYLKEKH